MPAATPRSRSRSVYRLQAPGFRLQAAPGSRLRKPGAWSLKPLKPGARSLQPVQSAIVRRRVSVPRRKRDPAHAHRHDGVDRGQRARLASCPGRRGGVSAGGVGLQSGADPRRADVVGQSWRRISDGRRRGVPDGPRPSDAARDHLHVPARLVDALARQHVVPVALRQQRRGCDDAHPLRGLLPRLRAGRGAAPGGDATRPRWFRWWAPRGPSAA